ncbi:MAG: hypothetical protein KQJ78_04650 [Deltaproteobacteria bacterium]|nr:hypothetical protein [Deltaproteobacteria bacterium]
MLARATGRVDALGEFLAAHPGFLEKLPENLQPFYLTICGYITHLRSAKSRVYFMEMFQLVQGLAGREDARVLLEEAVAMGPRQWALVKPFLETARGLEGSEESLRTYARFVRALATSDMDVALVFLNQTPGALERFGPADLLGWGRPALECLEAGRLMWKPARAYLEEAVTDRCATTRERWCFLLEQAQVVAMVSENAAEAFIRLGSQACLLLNEEETKAWVDQGLKTSVGEEDLVDYFKAVSFRSLASRDNLASGLPLTRAAGTLALLCEAFLGRPLKIRANSSLAGVAGFRGGGATDGSTVYLPPTVPGFSHYKLMALHQAALLRNADHNPRDLSPDEHAAAHLVADAKLLEVMPGLKAEMAHLAGEEFPAEYPHDLPRPGLDLPWWGDYLPHLTRQTRSTVERIKTKAAEEVDLPPEVLERLVTYMMSQGQRDENAIWNQLTLMFDDLEMLSPDAEDLEENFQTFFYKEWDANQMDYKSDWCLVRQRRPPSDPNDFVARTRDRMSGLIGLIRRQFTRLKPEQFKRYRAQPAGDDLDLDALVEAVVDMTLGASYNDNVYIRRDKRVRDVGVLFLVDLSGSTAEVVKGRRVIDLQKEAMVLMSEALDTLGDPFAIFGFSSRGRFRVDLWSVKDFGEPWSANAQYRLGALEPLNLTRMGAVIRHGIHKLANLPATIKLLIILTDGRPYDLEYGNLEYACHDTKKALMECKNHRINPFIITSDQKGADYLKFISPETQAIIVPQVELLPFKLPAMYKRLTT